MVEKNLLACGSDFVGTYGINFIEKIKMLIFENKIFLSEFRFIFRHSARIPIKCVPLISIFFFEKTMIELSFYKKQSLLI